MSTAYMPGDPQKLKQLIAAVINEGGSDLHLPTGHHPTIRVNSTLIPLLNFPELSDKDVMDFLTLMLSKDKRDQFLENQEVDFSYAAENGNRFRCNAYFQQGRISVAMRYISAEIKTIEQLNLPPILEEFSTHQQGFFLVVGPVGHGKTTTLAAMVDKINTDRSEHIVTIEDPIEYQFTPKQSLIDQREISVDTKNFHTALQSVFRQDVDVIMIGEMRGPETISTAVTAAETGHLVFSTVHTNNAAQTINRIIDSFPAEQQNQIRSQLSQSLIAIFSQRLVPRVSGGLIPAYELMVNTTATANLIRDKRVHEIGIAIETGSDEGMIDMNRTLAELVKNGEITPENAYAFSTNHQGLKRMI